MELYYRLLEFNNSLSYETLKTELGRLGANYTVKKLTSSPDSNALFLEFIVGASEPLFGEIERLVSTQGFYFQTGIRFSEQERRSAEWLYANVSESQYPQPKSDFRYLQATYDTSAYCQRCGIGAHQARPFRLSSDFKLKRSHFFGLHWVFDEIFVRPGVKTVFDTEGITGVDYCHPVQNRSGQDIVDTLQLRIGICPEPGLVTERLVAETCQPSNPEATFATGRAYPSDYPFCGRTKYNYPTRDAIRFRRESLKNCSDMIKSHEYFGNAAGAHRLILVSRKFADVIEQHRLRGILLTPVLLE